MITTAIRVLDDGRHLMIAIAPNNRVLTRRTLSHNLSPLDVAIRVAEFVQYWATQVYRPIIVEMPSIVVRCDEILL